MGFRFRKSVSILPGVKLNLSKGGVSLTLGGKGVSLNVGKNGARGTVGVPGTGMSYSTKLDGNLLDNLTGSGKKKTTKRKTARRSTAKSSSEAQSSGSILDALGGLLGK